MNIKEKFWIGTFISLWVLVSTVSTFHSVEFFGLSNNLFFSWCIAIGFEIGAMASLGGLLISRGNKVIIWVLFIILTFFQIHGNMYWAWSHSGDITEWTKLFDLVDEEPNFTKRIFAFISGGILPLVSLGFIKSLMDYMKPEDLDQIDEDLDELEEDLEESEEEVKEEVGEAFDIPETFTGGNGDSDTWGATAHELNIKNNTNNKSNLEDIIDNAENTINSIGEK